MKFNKSHSLAYKSGLAMTMMLGLTILTASGVSAQAEEISKSKVTQTRSVYLVKHWFGNDVQYGKNPAGKVFKISASDYMNSNPYVCTPSGFGRKARCRAI